MMWSSDTLCIETSILIDKFVKKKKKKKEKKETFKGKNCGGDEALDSEMYLNVIRKINRFWS